MIGLSTVGENFGVDSKQLVSVHRNAGSLHKVYERRNSDSSIVFSSL